MPATASPAGRPRCSPSTRPPARRRRGLRPRPVWASRSRTCRARCWPRPGPLDVDHDSAGALDLAAANIDASSPRRDIGRDRVLGAGMALAGPIDHERGALYPSAVLPGWAGVDAAKELEDRLGAHLRRQRRQLRRARRGHAWAPGRNARFAAYVSISSGIGAGMVVDGRPYRGLRRHRRRDRPRRRRPAGTDLPLRQPRLPGNARLEPGARGLVQASREDEITSGRSSSFARDGDPGCRRAIADAAQWWAASSAGL